MFRLGDFPPPARKFFNDAPLVWPTAVAAAIEGGETDLNDLTNLVFYMHHKERMDGQIGRPLEKGEKDFDKLAAEWTGFQTMVRPMLTTAGGGNTSPQPPTVEWKLLPHERSGVLEAGGKAFLGWAETAPKDKVETAEFSPTAKEQDKFKTIFAWKSASPNLTCLASPKKRLQFVMMLRDDLTFWRAHSKTENQAVIMQTAQAAAIRAYRLHVLEHKLCPEAARLKEIDQGRQLCCR